MNTGKKTWLSDRGFFWLVLGISLVVPAVVILLRVLPAELRPNGNFARHLPGVNAIINSAVSVLLVSGYLVIRKTRNKRVHQFIMLSAFTLSVCFLACYVIYHLIMPHQVYCGEGLTRYIYFTLLASHIVLAGIILPMVLYTVYYSASGRYEKHRKIARFTFPIWLYVSVSGVLVYLLISQCYSF